MSKSMAIEGVMKIFVMVAVLIVAVSFLLKAFGIDLFGWLEEKLGGAGGPPESGSAVHVKFDTNPPELWEFHLTDGDPGSNWKELFGNSRVKVEESDEVPQGTRLLRSDEGIRFFGFDGIPGGRCILFATEEEGGEMDKAMIYEVKEGAIIDKEQCKDGTNLKDCLKDNILEKHCNLVSRIGDDKTFCTGSNCELKASCSCSGDKCSPEPCQEKLSGTEQCQNYRNLLECRNLKSPMTISEIKKRCDTKENLLNDMKFGTAVDYDKCKDKPGRCNLLGESKKVFEVLEENKVFKVKFGVICDDGKWRACTKKTLADSRTVGEPASKSYKCTQKDENTFVWELTS